MSLKSVVDEYTLSQRRLLDDTEKVYSRLLDALAQERNALKTITDERDTLRPLSGVLQDARRINDDLRAQLSVSQKAVTTLNSELIATKEALRVAQRAVARETARASETTWCVCDGSGQFTKRRWINDKMMQEVTETCPAESHFETVGGCVVGNSANYVKTHVTREQNIKAASTGPSVLHVPEPSKKPTPPVPAPAQLAHVGGSLRDQVLKAAANPPLPAPGFEEAAKSEVEALKRLTEVPDSVLDDILRQVTEGSRIPFNPTEKDRLNAKEIVKTFLDLQSECNVQ